VHSCRCVELFPADGKLRMTLQQHTCRPSACCSGCGKPSFADSRLHTKSEAAHASASACYSGLKPYTQAFLPAGSMLKRPLNLCRSALGTSHCSRARTASQSASESGPSAPSGSVLRGGAHSSVRRQMVLGHRTASSLCSVHQAPVWPYSHEGSTNQANKRNTQVIRGQ
jgi:hypothetical protein